MKCRSARVNAGDAGNAGDAVNAFHRGGAETQSTAENTGRKRI
jgi:hypothetical protein